MQESSIVTKSSGLGRGDKLVYWMQAAQRTKANPALDYAITRANGMQLPLLVLFVLYPGYPEANIRHFSFMLQGIHELAGDFYRMGIAFHVLIGEPVEQLSRACKTAIEVVSDHGYLRIQRKWRSELHNRLGEMGVAYTEIETEAMVPVRLASAKQEYAAATLRPKLLKQLAQIQITVTAPVYKGVIAKLPESLSLQPMPHKLGLQQFMDWVDGQCEIDTGVPELKSMVGGNAEARALLKDFISNKIGHYSSKRNNPGLNVQSGLSPYLHFGQISPMEIVQQLMDESGFSLLKISSLIRNKEGLGEWDAGLASFAEELIVRRELSFNFCHYNEHYDSFACLPAWVKTTLLNHISDIREEHYSLDRLEQCATSDVYWNAAQQEMMETGKMHNYMRMYWGKRLIAWFASPEEAFSVMLYLNNKYSLDGRDPNSFAGVAWCFGMHDRPWMNREIYGMVRYMNMAGLKRKFDMGAYLAKVNAPGRNDA